MLYSTLMGKTPNSPPEPIAIRSCAGIEHHYIPSRVNKLPKWARDYIHQVETFIGAEEVKEIIYLRDQNRALIKMMADLKAENRRLQRRIEKQRMRK